ncbi:MAG TPA: DUF4363 family protein [Bacillota bacterium]|jgi:hypothetical protein|nr:DUF4363 family protein [Bacillota bacterium]HOL10112.1 DUF4363 family protein [Bacillota bacterium]HPO97892.1 DUF4363 family protein [Bacillota bacterium]
MKIWLISVVILALTVFFGISTEKYFDHSSQRLLPYLKNVELDINRENWSQAKSQLNQFKQQWQQEKKVWYILTNHREIDFIEESLSKLTKAVNYQGKIEAQIELGIISHFLNHVPERERLNSTNIF